MKDSRRPITIRFPGALLAHAKAINRPGSFNDLVVKALEAEIRIRYPRQVGRDIDKHRAATFRAHGLLSDSTPVIRDLREGIGRWD